MIRSRFGKDFRSSSAKCGSRRGRCENRTCTARLTRPERGRKDDRPNNLERRFHLRDLNELKEDARKRTSHSRGGPNSSMSTAALRKPRPIAENRIFVAAIAIVGVGAAQGILNSFDIFGSKAMTEMLAFLACTWLFPDEPRRKWSLRLAVGLIATGLLAGAIWVLFIGFPGRHGTNFTPLTEVPLKFYALGLLTSCVVAPLFEEKVVRHLLLDGASYYFGKLAAAIGVSALFAAVHVDEIVSAFLLSLFLCVGTQLFNLNSAQRSVIHGLVNFSILHWVLFYPTLRSFLQSALASSSYVATGMA